MIQSVAEKTESPIESIDDLSEYDRQFMIFEIMHYRPIKRVRDRILEEVIKFKWTDSEEYGFDLYSNFDPKEQLIVAGFEWRRRYWQDFFDANDTDGKDQPRKIK